MAGKRGATTDLNHTNWDQEDAVEEKGFFKRASAEEIKSRVIKVARRTLESGADIDLPKLNVFSNISGFGNGPSTSKATPFSFLPKPATCTSTSTSTSNDIFDDKDADISGKFLGKSSTPNTFKFEDSNKYYVKLRALNQSVSNWIKKHVDENPVCILSPIFKDYEKYLAIMQKNQNGGDGNGSEPTKRSKLSSSNDNKVLFATASTNTCSPKSDGYKFLNSPSNATTSSQKSAMKNFSFLPEAIKNDKIPESNTLLNFGKQLAQDRATATKTSTFGSSSGTPLGGFPFSFGSTAAIPSTSKPFTFGCNVIQPTSDDNGSGQDLDEQTEPPKVEFTAVVEEDSVYSKKCKVFIKNDGNYADCGVGTLYLKPVKDSNKTQLLVRADTNLGNVLINLLLCDGIPTQRLGKNNVMMVCKPTPELADKPPRSVLFRVKTADDADELLETINKFKE